MKGANNPDKYILLDANVLVGYYLPEAVSSRVAHRIESILECCRKGKCREWYLLVPNLVIAEVFTTFAKYCYATWNSHVKKALPDGLDQRRYKRVCRIFHQHIHNGQFLHQVELNRYHILAVDLIAPIDNHYQFYRGKRRRKTPMGTADILILAMGIHLNHQFGHQRFLIVTADRRMTDICGRAASMNKNTAERLGIVQKANDLGYGYHPQLYPTIVNLAGATRGDLERDLGVWPPDNLGRCTTGVRRPW